MILEKDWSDNDPGWCPDCGTPWQWVRPGKSQPVCECGDFCECGKRYECYSDSFPHPYFKNVFGYCCAECDKKTYDFCVEQEKLGWPSTEEF